MALGPFGQTGFRRVKRRARRQGARFAVAGRFPGVAVRLTAKNGWSRIARGWTSGIPTLPGHADRPRRSPYQADSTERKILPLFFARGRGTATSGIHQTSRAFPDGELPKVVVGANPWICRRKPAAPLRIQTLQANWPNYHMTCKHCTTLRRGYFARWLELCLKAVSQTPAHR